MDKLESQETEILGKVVPALEPVLERKSFDELTEDEQTKVENDVLWRFLENYYPDIYKKCFRSTISSLRTAWFGDRLWKNEDRIPTKYAEKMHHLRKVMDRLRSSSFTINSAGRVEFNLEDLLVVEKIELEGITKEERREISKSLSSFDPSEMFSHPES